MRISDWSSDVCSSDLSGANLSAIRDDGQSARTARTNLGAAKLKKALLVTANLDGARLVGADLRDADLRQAILHGAAPTDCRFVGAQLTRVQPTGPRRDPHPHRPPPTFPALTR